jgi:hypothetical protein
MARGRRRSPGFTPSLKEKPTPPREPTAEECCGKGCTPCVFDQYAEALERYKAQLKKVQEEDNLKKPN